ncbi:Lactosylceramide 4-alpha-galactosyltransferase [Chamberlinius hualienensis]
MVRNMICQSFKTALKFTILVVVILTTSVFYVMQPKIFQSAISSYDMTKFEATNIFMVETRSDKRYMTAREACSMESAALQNHLGNLTMYKIGQLYAHDDAYLNNLLKKYTNIKFVVLNFDEIFEGTPLYPLTSGGHINKSRFPLEHWSDAVRLALLWKEGGIYLDTDTIVIKPLVNLNNSVALESDMAANGFMSFEKGSNFLLSYMAAFSVGYNGQIWGAQGPVMITKILQQYCNVTDLTTVINSPNNCSGINILPRKKLFPFRWQNWEKLFQKPHNAGVDISNSYTVHLFNSQSKKRVTKVGVGSLLEELFRKYCPSIYQMISKTKYMIF